MVKTIALEQKWGATCDILESIVYGEAELLTERWVDPEKRIDFYKIVSPVVITRKDNECIDKITYCIYCNREDYYSNQIEDELKKGLSFLIDEVMKGRLTYGDDLFVSEECGLEYSDVNRLIDLAPIKDVAYFFTHTEDEDVIYGDYETVTHREGGFGTLRYTNILKSSLALTKTKSAEEPPYYKIFVRKRVKAQELKDAVNKLASENAREVDVIFADRDKEVLKKALVWIVL